MMKTIRLRIKKDIDHAAERMVMKLKGGLIAGGYTDLIHFDDEDAFNYINHFQVLDQNYEDSLVYIRSYISENNMDKIIEITLN